MAMDPGYGSWLLLANARSAGMTDRSEWNFVVHICARTAAHASPGGGRNRARRSRRAELAALIGADIAATARARAAGTIEQRQLAAKALQHRLGRVTVLAGLVLPFARL